MVINISNVIFPGIYFVSMKQTHPKYRLGLCANDLKNSNGLWQEPLLKIEINNPALLAGNWSQLCATCKVIYILFWLSLNFLHEALSPAINILHTLSYACPSILYL
jgi:hypothetical protein